MRTLAIDEPLVRELDHLAWAWGPAQSNAAAQTTAYYFSKLEDAQRFVTARP